MDRPILQGLQRLVDKPILIRTKEQQQLAKAGAEKLLCAIAESEGGQYASIQTQSHGARADIAAETIAKLSHEIEALHRKRDTEDEITERKVASLQSQLDKAQKEFENHKKSLDSELQTLGAMLTSKQQMVESLQQSLGVKGLVQVIGSMMDSLPKQERCFWLHILVVWLKEIGAVDGFETDVDPRVGKLQYFAHLNVFTSHPCPIF